MSAAAPVAWFWFAPFRGVVDQTVSALRAAAPGLRVRDPKTDRAAIGTRPGDVFIMTWASVAARNAESRRMRVDDDEAPALDNLVAQLRDAGLLLGAVVDEAHHSFKAGSQAFRFFSEVLRPDLLMLATATTDDTDVELLRRMLGIERFQRIAVARERVVAARLNKKSVKAISFVAHGANQNLLDLNKVALRKAVDQHRALKRDFKTAGIPVVPLLLVQAASAAWTPAKVRGSGIQDGGRHRFDAPRASTLCALRPVQDAGFGLQVIGRIMRVHPALQAVTICPRRSIPGTCFSATPKARRACSRPSAGCAACAT